MVRTRARTMFLTLVSVFFCIQNVVSSQLKYEKPHSDFLNYGIKRLKPSRGFENEIIKSKVEVLGDVLKAHVNMLRKTPGQNVELVFLVDSSASVGAENFFNELKFVKKLLADFTVSYNQTRVAVVTFSSKSKVLRHIDHVTQAAGENHKCSLLERELPQIRYSGGGTYTLGALMEAQSVLALSRPDAVKAVFLVTDGYSNGGDPRPAAEFLKSRGVIIFTFGIQNGNVKELHDMASEPKEQHSYILDSFEEFEALARRALHEDLHTGMIIAQASAACSTLCDQRDDCCDDFARCTCGTHTGHYACTCRMGYYGTGLRGDCRPCPSGTYRDVEGPGDVTACKKCPDPNMLSSVGSTSPMQCYCNRGYTQHGLQCEKLRCLPLNPPPNGYFVRGNCENVVNAACGVRCRPGYELDGSSIRLCREDGTWSGGDATCVAKTCPALKVPMNGNMICSSETGSIDTQCHFTCKPGFQLVGSRMRTCLPVAMWDGIKAYCKPIFCEPLPHIKNGIVKPESCTHGKMRYGTICEFGCEVGHQLSGPLKTACIDQGVWSEGHQKARCIDVEPPVIECPGNIVTTTEPHENYALVEWLPPTAKDSSSARVHLSSIPATKQPMKLKIGNHKIAYVAKDEWGNKAKCVFSIVVKDEEPPTTDKCDSPPTFLSREEDVDVYWEEPTFSDNSGGPVTVTRSREPGRFSQGETLVQYVAKDESGNTVSCNISIIVQHHACDLPTDPINGYVNCTENPDAVYCTLTCEDGYAFAMRPSQDYFCAYDGVWLPELNPLPFPDCSVTSLSNTISQTGEIAMDDKDGSFCDDIFLMGQVENKLQAKLEDALSSVCADDLLCEIATVEAVCESILDEAEEEFNTLALSRRKRDIRERSYLSKFWPGVPRGWNYWRRGSRVELGTRRRKRAVSVVFHSNAKRRRQFGFPSSLFGDIDMNSTVSKQKEDNANFLGMLTGLIVQSLGNDIGMTRFSSFLTSLGSKEGSYRVNDFLAAFSKEFGEEKAKDLRKLAETRLGHITEEPLDSLLERKSVIFEKQFHSSHSGSSKFDGRVNFADDVDNSLMENFVLIPKSTNENVLYNKSDEKPDQRPVAILFPDETLDPHLNHTSKGLKIKFRVEGHGQRAGETIDTVVKDLLKSADAGLFDISFGENQLKVAAIRLAEDPDFICDPGSIPRDNLCVKCPVGTYFNVIVKDCQSCPSGSYQPEEGQVSCRVCPQNTSTKSEQAKSNNECKAMCLPGSFSSDTLEPCTTCGLGEYQNEYASTTCAPCPYGTTTWRRGAWLIEECKTPCPPGEVSETRLKPCLQCPKNYFQSEEGKRECLRCPAESTTDSSGSTSLSDCKGINTDMLAAYSALETLLVNECFSSPCQNGAACQSLDSGYVCQCLGGYIGQHCETETDECQSDPCLNNATCEDQLDAFICHCSSGFRGDLCEENIDDCNSNPCQNNASCVDQVDSFKCLCESGFTGEVCDSNIDDCANAPCSSLSTCVDGISDYVCVCPPGFTGRHCTTDIDDCDSSPCIHGTCTDLISDYQCACEPGYTGKQCKEDIDDCYSQPCTNNGTCTDWLSGFSCKCLPGFTGKLCEIKMSTDFVLEFASSGVNNYASVEKLPKDLNAVTVCFWMRTSDRENYGTPFSYATATYDNALTLTDYSGFVLYVNGEKRITDVSATDGQWHMICALWSTEGGVWSIYKDGNEVDSGSGLSADKLITSDGMFVIGQEQDQRGGKFSSPESFIGELTLLNVWGHDMEEEKLKQLYRECGRYDGDIYSWPDFQAGIKGQIKLKSSTFCRGCGVPYVPNHSSIVEFGSEAGNVVKFDCDKGYKINRGDEERSCLISGRWSGEDPECRPISCGFPDLLRNGDINGFSYDYGDVLTISCNKGFRLLGSEKRTCQPDGKWSGEEPKCKVIQCPNPNPMEHGILQSHLGSYLPTNKVAFACEEGFQMDGPAQLTCGPSGSWEGEKPSCQPEACAALPSVLHGVVEGSSSAPIQSARVSCNKGYRLQGTAEIVCTDDGKWEHPLPTCVKQACDKPPPVANGNVQIRVSQKGKEAVYKCDQGYILEGASKLICTADGEWDNPWSKCVPQPCPHPEVPQYAVIQEKDKWSVGDEAIYGCLPGYILIGNSKKTCLHGNEEGHWEGDSPVCREITCRAPLTIEGGKWYVEHEGPENKETEEFYPTAELELVRRRRKANDKQSISFNYEQKEDDGQASYTDDFPQLGQAQGNFDYGQSVAGGLEYGQSADDLEFGQHAGGLELGQSVDALEFGQSADGLEFGQSADALEIRKTAGGLEFGPSADALEFGQSTGDLEFEKSQSGLKFGQSAGGLEFGQSATTGLNFQKTTDALSEDFGQSTDGLEFGQSTDDIEYEQLQGALKYSSDLESNQSQDGLDYGLNVFSQSPEEFDFDYTQVPDKFVKNSYPYNTSIEYECNPGFKLLGYKTLRCAETGEWDHPEPRCYELHCPDLKAIENGYATYHGSGAKSRVTFNCNEGYELRGDNEIICQQDRTWSKNIPTCKQLSCPVPVEPVNGTVAYPSTNFGSIATYDCFHGFVLEGSFERHCGTNGFWNGSVPRCIGIICKTPSVIDKGYIYYEGNLNVESLVEYGCNDCYKLIGTSVRECQLDGTWSLEEPHCELINCENIPAELQNGKVIGGDISCGSLVEYECNPGYFMKGLTKASCTEDGKWTSPSPVCVKIICEPPPKVANAKIKGQSFRFTDQVSYDCEEGHNLIGNNILTCNADKNWSGDIPKCEKLFCQKPKGPSNGRVRVNGLFYGATVVVICDPGFRIEGDSVLQCQANSKWDKEMPFCAPIICPVAPNPPNSYYNSTELYFESFSYLKYQCEKGYETDINNTVIICGPKGNWEGNIIDCKPVYCGDPGQLKNGRIEGSQYTYGNVIDFFCDKGFQLIGEKKATCRINGKWSKKPTCQKISCGSPKQVRHASVTLSTQQGEYGSSVFYECQKGYMQIGSPNRTCEINSKWSGKLPSCQPVLCLEPPDPINADIIGDVYEFNRNITYVCHPGYTMKEEPVLTCLDTGQWSSEFPVCEMILCSAPKDVPNAKWINKNMSEIPMKMLAATSNKERTRNAQGTKSKNKSSAASKLASVLNGQFEKVLYRAGDVIEYSCDNGYIKTTSGIIECTINGWNLPPPICLPITCPFPLKIPHGKVHIKDINFGSSITYECDEGYEIFGVTTRVCQANEEWTDTEPYCRQKECPRPAIIHSGNTIYESTKYQSVVSYSCLPGFRLDGNATRICQSDETWSGEQPVCVEIFCDEPEEVPYAVRDIDSLKVGGNVRYSCMEGYRMDGISSMNCQNDGTWHTEPPKCILIDCGPPPMSPHLFISGDSTTYASKIKYNCERGYKLEGIYWTTCLQSGIWSNLAPRCNLITCDQPTTPDHGLLSNMEVYTVDAEITYSCEPGWETVGEKTLVCTQDGRWSDQPPVCQRVSCGPPLALKHARYVGENYLYGDVITFSCEQGYLIKGDPSISCSASREWTGLYPLCEPVTCGPPTILEHTHVSYEVPEHGLEHSFGSVVTYSCHYGYQLEGSVFMTCTASGRWVGPRESPICRDMLCNKPPDVQHATGNEEHGSRPQRVSYKCDPGYVSSGTSYIECHLGKWNDLNLTCNPVNCYEPAIPPNGKITSKHFMLGSVANYSCVQGYVLIGNTSVECGVDAKWIGIMPRCEPVDCKKPESPLNGKVKYISTLYTSSASYLCDEGYELKGDVSRLCSSDGTWSGHLPQCHRVSCGEIRPPHNGFVIGVGELYGDQVKFTCDKGYVLKGNDTAMCESDGTWSETGQKCESVRCVPPTVIHNGKPPEDLTRVYVYGDSISYICDEGHIARGDLTSVCDKDGAWTLVKGQCSLISCGRPKLNKDGAVILGRSFYYKDKIRISCPSGTRPNGPMLLTCLSDGSWSADASCVGGCNKTCLNGGVCLSENICSCPTGFIGNRCQHAICNLECLNGGSCVAPFRCHCLKGYDGYRCQTPVCEHGCGLYGKCIGPNVCLCRHGETGITCPDYSDYDYEGQRHATHFSDWDIAALRLQKVREED